MGLLDNILGGNRRDGGGPSAMTMALMALLAYRTYQGKGRLAEMMGRTGPDSDAPVPGAGNSNRPAAPEPEGGGLGGLLGSILGGQTAGSPGSSGGGLGDLLRGGGLGGMLGGAAGGGFLGAGLNEIVKRMQQNGHGDAANSWVGTGANNAVSGDQLEKALGRDTLQELSKETGKPYDEVLSQLSRGLPDTIDQLTPQGRMPTPEEHDRWL